MKLSLAPLGWIALAGTPLSAQHLSGSFDGPAPGARLGQAFDTLPDLDGDGLPELIAGYPGDDTAAEDAGRVVVFSTAEGSTLYVYDGEQAGDRIGTSVSDAGDVDADGVEDFMFGSPTANGGNGAMWLCSGADGSLIHFQRGLRAGEDYALSMDRAGDVDADGYDDYVIGVPGRREAGGTQFGHGEVWVYSGRTQARLFVIQNPTGVQIRYGTFVGWIGDVDADGHDDVFAASPEFGEWWVPGVYTIHSGLDGSLLAYEEGVDWGHGFSENQGLGITGVGDVDGDERADYVVGFGNLWSDPHAVLYSGATFTAIRDYPNVTVWEPLSMAGVGDTDGDGVRDLAIRQHANEVVVYSALSAAVLQRITWPSSADAFAAAIHDVGDFDGDGLSDVAIGIPLDDEAGADAGKLAIYSANPCGPAESYCSGAPSSAGDGAWMHHGGSSSLARNDLELRVGGAPPGQFGLFYYAPSRIDIPFGDGRRCAGGGFFRLGLLMTGADGTAAYWLDLTAPRPPAGEITAGSVWNFQFLYRDPAGPGGTGFNASDGLAIAFCP